ncbi:MAG: carboxypeptidase-like regulatory domain-containing protein, partial [Pseudomonadota bacterium]
MKLKYLLAASVVSLSAAATFTAPVQAQTITSAIEGTVTDEAGMPLAGATATITDTRTNREVVAVTDSSGFFRSNALQPGGPYTVTVTAPGYEGQTIESTFINISGNTAFTFELASTASGASDSTIVVTGARARVTQVAVGPGSAFGTEELEAFPS